MSLKILAVDDSATMRAIFQMTFAGEDAEVVLLDTAEGAVDVALRVSPDIVLIDSQLGGESGYDVARAIKQAPSLTNTRVLLLASQHHPFDDERASENGIDDHILKPFDTQHMIDRVKRLVLGSASLPPPARPASAFAMDAPPPLPGQSIASIASAQSTPAAPRATVAPSSLHPAAGSFEDRPSIVMTSRPHASEEPGARISETVARVHDSALAIKLEGLGLSAEQVSAIVALSRDVVERVVWEVVPDLAETIIREELKRLTAE